MKTRNEQLKKLALAAVLSIGAGLVWGVVLGCGTAIIDSIISSRDISEQLAFLRDGTPVVMSQPSNDYSCRTFHTLEGKPLDLEDSQIHTSAPLATPPDAKKRFHKLPWRQRILYMYGDWYAPESWYFISDGELHGHGYFEGYDKITKLKIGCIGRNGFHRDIPPLEEQFPINGRKDLYSFIINYYSSGDNYRTKYLLADDGCWQINLKKRTAKVVLQDAELISGAMSFKPQSETEQAKKEQEPTILLRTPQRIHVLDKNGNQTGSFVIPPELRKARFSWFPLQGGKAVMQRHGDPQHDNELFWINAKGDVLRRQCVNLHVGKKWPQALDLVFLPIIVPVPAIVVGIFVVFPWAAHIPEWVSYPDALREALFIVWPMFIFVVVIGLVLAWLTYRRQQKFALPWTGAWTAFVLIFGLPAYLGYLAHYSWPVRLPCPSCGQTVPRDWPTCTDCGSDFPPPPPKGIEIFA